MMLDHVSITVTDMKRAAKFYDAIMSALDIPCVAREPDRLGYGLRNRPDDDSRTYLSVRPSTNVVPDRRHWCFRAPNRAAVEAFHAAGIAAGGTDDGAPGLRPNYHATYYAAFLSDPD